MNHQALIVMDMQNGIVNGLQQKEAIIANNQIAIETARRHSIPVIFVRVAFTGEYMEVSANNKMFSQMKAKGIPMNRDDKSTQIVEALKRQVNEPLVTKHRLSAFAGSNLEVLLRGLQVDHLVLTGVSTSGVVLSTSVEAADKDYKLTVLSDAVADQDEEKHQFLIDKILTRYADVITTEAWYNN
ncbi:cysteine hydrolase [Staphylococcus sp. GSSP0090]|nr:cysteine hydrolase [Staphylococcus sp. GSSP0090]